jgi:hypothetical protein
MNAALLFPTSTHQRRRPLRWLALLLGLGLLALVAHAQEDPPSRVARLAYGAGMVSFAPAGEDEWVQAGLNRPMTNGDRLWVDNGGRAELDLGNAAVRLDGLTSANILNLDDRLAQFQLTQGTANVDVRTLREGEYVEIDTPNLAVTLRQPGSYRVNVDAGANATTVGVRSGQAEVIGEGAAYLVNPGQSYRFAGLDLRAYQLTALAPDTDFDRWSGDRERALARSVSARYVAPTVIGYQELDAYGSWRDVPDYGYVWVPARVAVDWAPYHDGHWVWVQPWGWTWVDRAPWGFAPFHYGRWVHLYGGWCWVPGPRYDRPVYAPALVAFVGGPGFQIGVGGPGVAWFPLGPRDVYRPAYSVSRNYFTRVNVSNTFINVNVVSSHFDNPHADNGYMNRHIPGAVIAVPATAFGQNQSMTRAAMRLPGDALARAPIAGWAPVAPAYGAITAGAASGQRPPAFLRERPVFAHTPPPAPPVSFAAQQGLLANRGGQPLSAGERVQLQQAQAPSHAAAGLPPVRTLPYNAVPGPAPAVGPANPGDNRGRRDPQGDREAFGRPGLAPTPAPQTPAAQPSPPSVAPAFTESRRGMERQERPTPQPAQVQPQPMPAQPSESQRQIAPAPQPRPRPQPDAPRAEQARVEPLPARPEPRIEPPRPTPQPQPQPQAQPHPRSEPAPAAQATHAPGAEKKAEEERKREHDDKKT